MQLSAYGLFRHLPVEVGNGGWVRAWPDVADALIYVRYEDAAGRLRAVEIYIEPRNGGEVTTDLLRLPFGEIDRRVNAQPVAAAVRQRLATPGPDLSTAAAAFMLPPAVVAEGGTWVEDMLASQAPDSAIRAGTKVAIRRPESPDLLDDEELVRLCQLRIPTTKSFPDDFYESVAKAYIALSQVTTSPSPVLADINGVAQVDRVRKWVSGARKRGYLPPGRAGKVG
jgi:hypothetical protein